MQAIKKPSKNWTLFCLGLFNLILLNGCMPPGPRALLKGEALIHERKYAEAQEKLEQAARLLPENAQAWNHLGLAYHLGGQPKKSVPCYQKAISLDRNLAAARFNLGCLQLEQKNYPAAIDSLITFVALHPNSTEGWLKLGVAQLRQASQTTGAEKIRHLDAARKSFDALMKLASSAEALNDLGIIQVQRNRPRDAIGYFNAALQEQPRFSPALLNLAVVHHQYLNDRPVALQKYHEYLAVTPHPDNGAEVEAVARQIDLELNPVRVVPATNPPPVLSPIPSNTLNTATPPPRNAVTNLARVEPNGPKNTTLPRLGMTNPISRPAAVDIARLTNEPALQPARDSRPSTSPDSVREATNRPGNLTTPTAATAVPEKKTIFQKMNPINLFRKKPKTVASRGATETAVAVPETKSAELEIRDGVTPLPPKPAWQRYKYNSPPRPVTGRRAEAEGFFVAGVKAQREGRLPEAMAAYRQAVKRDPGFAEAYYNLGLAGYESGDLSASLSAYELALAADPASLNARYNFSLALQKGNYPQDAAAELEKLLQTYPGETRAHLSLANLYAQQLYDFRAARLHYGKVLELEPNHREAVNIRYWLAAHP